jgi:hypothetical protein
MKSREEAEKRSGKPVFSAGRNIAIKVPPHEYSRTVHFYKDIICLPVVEDGADSAVFMFGDKRLWIDKADTVSQSEIWLEIATNDIEEAARYLRSKGVISRSGIEELPEGFQGFWISSPANIIHLVTLEKFGVTS